MCDPYQAAYKQRRDIALAAAEEHLTGTNCPTVRLSAPTHMLITRNCLGRGQSLARLAVC
eukprot:2757693-Pyramimonas_sp.AAC.1